MLETKLIIDAIFGNLLLCTTTARLGPRHVFRIFQIALSHTTSLRQG